MSARNLILGSILALLVILGVSYVTSGFGQFTNAIVAWATLMLAVAAFLAIHRTMLIQQEQRREERRRLALERMRDWAEEVFSVTTMPTRHKNIEMRKSELVNLLHRTGAKIIGIQKDAELVGGNMHLAVNLAYLAIFKFDARLRGKDDIAQFKARYNVTDTIEPIRNLQELEDAKAELLNAVADVINAATERLVPLQ